MSSNRCESSSKCLVRSMNSLTFLSSIRSNPMLSGPMGQQARQMLNDPNFRRMLTDPEMMRNMSQMRRQFGGPDPFGGQQAGGNPAFPMPGNAEPGQQDTATQPRQEGQQGQTPGTGTATGAPANPFGAFGNPGGGAAGGNPFAALFGGAGGFPPAQGAGLTPSTDSTQQPEQQQPQGQPAAQNPFNAVTQMLMQNPQAMQEMMGAMGGGNANPAGPNAANPQQGQNPFAALQQMGLGGFNPAMFGGGGFSGGAPAQPPDDRPPEDRYADQLRQLNEMGFHSFERNVEALRRTGGSVQGAIEYLLNQP